MQPHFIFSLLFLLFLMYSRWQNAEQSTVTMKEERWRRVNACTKTKLRVPAINETHTQRIRQNERAREREREKLKCGIKCLVRNGHTIYKCIFSSALLHFRHLCGSKRAHDRSLRLTLARNTRVPSTDEPLASDLKRGIHQPECDGILSDVDF